MPTLEKLLVECATGNRTALGELYNYTYSRLVSFARTRLPKNYPGRETAAEDAVQNTFLMVLEKANHFDPAKGSCLTWLRTICRNIVRDMIRRWHRSRTGYFSDVQISDLPQEQHRHGDGTEPAKGTVPSLLRQLPQELRTIAALKWVDGIPQRTIANLVGCSPSTVSRRLKMAKQILNFPARCAA